MRTGTLLSIETSTPRGSLALVAEDGEVLLSRVFESERSHNSLLFAPLQEVIDSGYSFDAIIVGVGPGSYTGVRIGVSAALGISLANRAKVTGVSSLVALEAAPSSGSYHVIGDARRGSFFHAVVRDWKVLEAVALVSEQELFAHFSAAELPVLTCDVTPLPIAAQVTFPDATALARAARYQKLDFATAVEPIYLRAPYTTTPKPKGRPPGTSS